MEEKEKSNLVRIGLFFVNTNHTSKCSNSHYNDIK